MAERKLSAAFIANIKKRKNPLTYDKRMYVYVDTARQIPDPKAEYRKLRTTALNRIRKLERAGYADTETVRKARAAFAALPKNLTAEQAAQRLPDAARFLLSARGTVGGMREIERKTAQTFNDRGLDFINSKNIRQFTEFLDWLGAKKANALFGSDFVSETPPREGGDERRYTKVEEIRQAFENWRLYQ